MSAVKRILNRAAHRPFRKYITGWVVGIIYNDGFEWLYHKQGLCSQGHERADYHATTYSTKEKAVKAAKKVADQWQDRPLFIREYIWETPDGGDLPLLGDRSPEMIMLRGEHPGFFYKKNCSNQPELLN